MEDNKTSTELILAQRQDPPASGALETGVWYSDFARVRAEAEKTGKPLFAMWINPGCGFCKRFCGNVNVPKFADFMKTSGMLFWLGSATDKEGRGGAGWDFVIRQSDGHAQHYFPLCAIVQWQGGKIVHDYRVSGRKLENEKTGEEGTDSIIATVRRVLAEAPYALEKPMPQQAPQGHPHLSVLQQVAKLVAPFAPQVSAKAEAPKFRVRFNPNLDPVKLMRYLDLIGEKGGHCPTADEQTSATVCQCAEFAALDRPGLCRCGLFEKYAAK